MRLILIVSCWLLLSVAFGWSEEGMPMEMHYDHHEHAAPPSAEKEFDHTNDGQDTTDKGGSHSDHHHGSTNAPSKKHRDHDQDHSAAGHQDGHSTHVGHTARMHEGHMGGMHEGHEMKEFFGPYPMNREGSGTSWQPDATPHEGVHQTYGDWMLMEHALINGIYDQQGGPRGGNKAFIGGMVMGMAERAVGDGTLGLRAMLSPDPFMGPSGYPLLLATGETANGVSPLIDRQHPHDLFMELAGSYSYNLSSTSSVFVYAGLPGEPALGPPAFMHRTSGWIFLRPLSRIIGSIAPILRLGL